MPGPTFEELRELSRRSRKTQRAGFLGLAAGLALPPAATLAGWGWPTLVALLFAGAALLVYAYVAGEERGAFRRTFRRLRETRSIVPDAPRALPPVRGQDGRAD